MPKDLGKIIQEIFVDQNITKLQQTKQDIKKHLGQKFFKKQIKNMFLQKNKIIIETKTIEAKTEINIIKKNFNTKTTLL